MITAFIPPHPKNILRNLQHRTHFWTHISEPRQNKWDCQSNALVPASLLVASNFGIFTPPLFFARKTELNKTVAATGIKYDLTSYF
jgi:hypothetical protein